MEVLKNASLTRETPARQLTMEAMQADFEYRMAEKLTEKLLEQGFLTDEEFNKITALNREKFSPFLPELMG